MVEEVKSINGEFEPVAEPSLDVVRCDCGHDEDAENVCKVGDVTACLQCYEEARAAEEGDRGTYELHGGYR